MSEVTLGGEKVTIERFSVRKAVRVIHTIQQISRAVPQVLEEAGEFVRSYERQHVTEIPRATARYQITARPLLENEPLLDADNVPMLDRDGNVIYRQVVRLDANGSPVMGPDPLGHMSEEDWASSDHMLKMPRTPRREEVIAAIFPTALELAEKETLELLALLAMSNTELRAAEKAGFRGEMEKKLEWLYELPADDLIELAVASGEAVDDQFRSRVQKMGDRLGNALRLFGLSLKSQEETSKTSSSMTTPQSSTDSPPSTDGALSESSTIPTGSSSPVSAGG